MDSVENQAADSKKNALHDTTQTTETGSECAKASTGEPKVKRKPAVVTHGVLDEAKKLLREGKSDQEVIAGLITMYTAAGKGAKQAKHNALTTLFHAKKRVAKES